MIIPHERLAPETLKSLVESFIAREGTDYGFGEVSLQTKVDQVTGQIQKSEVVIVFDDKSDSINILPRADAIQWSLNA